ncbi:MAG: hypothetical protein ACM359_24435 [Bacillota bacterium]
MCKRITFVLAGSLGPVGIVEEDDSAESTTEVGTSAKGTPPDRENRSHQGEATSAGSEKQNPR